MANPPCEHLSRDMESSSYLRGRAPPIEKTNIGNGLRNNPHSYNGINNTGLRNSRPMPSDPALRLSHREQSLGANKDKENIKTVKEDKYETMTSAEKKKYDKWAHKRIKGLGRCPAKFPWVRIPRGYMCIYANHMVTDDLLQDSLGKYYFYQQGEWHGPMDPY